MQASIEREFPAQFREAGIGGATCVWFYVDAKGNVLRYIVRQPSGYHAPDSAAMRVAGILRFAPARNGDTTVRAWVAYPIPFNVTRWLPLSLPEC